MVGLVYIDFEYVQGSLIPRDLLGLVRQTQLQSRVTVDSWVMSVNWVKSAGTEGKELREPLRLPGQSCGAGGWRHKKESQDQGN